MRGKPLQQPTTDLATLANRQHGVVSVRQLITLCGYSRSAIDREVAARRLHRLHRGVFAVGHTQISTHGKCLAAVLTCGPGALLSHRSAAWLWGLSRRSPLPAHVIAPVPRKERPPIVLHRSVSLTDDDRKLVEGIPVTSVPRTLLDSAVDARPGEIDTMLERGEELRLFDLRAVDDLLDRAGTHPGRGPLGRAIALYRPPPFSRSGLERAFLGAVAATGLPQPATGFNVAGHELDVYWVEERFAVELDVYETHGTRAAFERDHQRDEDLMLAGIEVMRVTGPRFERDPGEVIRRVAQMLARRRGP
jgi:Transcriptional regulator, AbiEi antitoxin